MKVPIAKNPFLRRSPNIRNGLAKLCLAVPKNQRNKMAEIGSYAGDSTIIFATYFKEVNAIDPWEWTPVLQSGIANHVRQMESEKRKKRYLEAAAAFDDNTEEYENIVKIKRRDKRALNMFEDESLDLVYIDSIHTLDHAGSTALRWWNKIKRGGHLSGHDCCKRYPEIETLVDILSDMLKQKPQMFCDTSWLFVKS